MRKVKKWRYYCDHCKKSGARGDAMKTHERHCCRNPERECRFCKNADLVQVSTPLLVAELLSNGLDALNRMTEKCPACMLTAIIHAKKQLKDDGMPEDEAYWTIVNHWQDFDYRKAVEAFWAVHEREDPIYGY